MDYQDLKTYKNKKFKTSQQDNNKIGFEKNPVIRRIREKYAQYTPMNI